MTAVSDRIEAGLARYAATTGIAVNMLTESEQEVVVAAALVSPECASSSAVRGNVEQARALGTPITPEQGLQLLAALESHTS